MRRVMALWLSVAFATLLSGLAVAQDGSTTTTGSTGTTDSTSTGSTVAAPPSGDGSATATGSATDSGMDAGTYAVRLRDLEQRINALKEQIFRSKARLSLLAETVLQGVVAGAQAVIVHENRMSSSYRLVKAQYALDGARIFSKADEEGALGDQQQFEVYNGSIVPGEHNITVNLEYRGNGYGIFSYLKGYRFRVRSSHSFSVPEGRTITIHAVAYEKGGPTAPLEERPAVQYSETVGGRDDGSSGDDAAAPSDDAASTSSGSGGT
jgi:hypothetical protein